MSIAEQEELLDDICNDVLGYGPLEPLLARDDIADIMVNGAGTRLHRSRRQDPAHQHPLPRQRAADEHLPAHRQPGRPPRRRILADLRRAPADGSRVNVIAPPLAIDGPRSPSVSSRRTS
jgi:pilus assembly protein CpaF